MQLEEADRARARARARERFTNLDDLPPERRAAVEALVKMWFEANVETKDGLFRLKHPPG